MNSLANTSKIICDILTIYKFFSFTYFSIHSRVISFPLLLKWKETWKHNTKKLLKLKYKKIYARIFRGILISFTYASQKTLSRSEHIFSNSPNDSPSTQLHSITKESHSWVEQCEIKCSLTSSPNVQLYREHQQFDFTNA